ncbi:MAG: amidohydrolase family protein [bacterium]
MHDMRYMIRGGLFAALFVAGTLTVQAKRPVRYVPMSPDRAYQPPVLAIDSHTHLGLGTADSLAAHMESLGLSRMVVLPPMGVDFDAIMKEFGRYPNRFAVLYSPDFATFNKKSWPKDIEASIHHAKDLGAAGIKLYKYFSVYLRDKDNILVPVDDPRFDPLWKAAEKYSMPILVHAGDPERFWMPPNDATNYIEDSTWAFGDTDVPFKETILRQLENVFKRYPNVTFVGAHVGNRSEDPLQVAWLLDQYPNVYVDLSARYGELAKHARETRWLLMQYPDRILLGTDWGVSAPDGFYDGWVDDAQRFYSRVHRILYTRDASIPTPFDGNEGPILVGTHRWAIDGWEIPLDVMKTIAVDTPMKVFFRNR